MSVTELIVTVALMALAIAAGLALWRRRRIARRGNRPNIEYRG